MQTITAIEPQKKNPRRVNIYLDGEFAFGLSKLAAAWLKVGQTLSEEKLTALREDDERDTVYQKALHFLSYRPRSAAEVRQNLNKHNVPEPLIAATLERLQRNGLVNDNAFARAWVENRSEFHPRSKSALRMELRRKGLSDEAIQSALEEGADEETLALDAARKYARRLTVRTGAGAAPSVSEGRSSLERAEFRTKLSGFLARRGFSYSTIVPVVSQIWQEIHQMADDREKTKHED
jgi:regulatory protein